MHTIYNVRNTAVHGVVAICVSFLGLLVGPQIAKAACDATELTQTTYLGMSGTQVRTLQTCLIEAGFSIPAGVTGYYGSQTKVAVTQFYATYMNMPAWDGMVVGPLGRSKLVEVLRGGGGSVVTPPPVGATAVAGYKRAGSVAVLAQYLAESKQNSYRSGAVGFAPLLAPQATGDLAEAADEDSAGRVSETTVQVVGIDEPDIVKTDGKNIYISKESPYYGRPVPMLRAEDDLRMMPDWQDPATTVVVEAFPPDQLAEVGDIKEKGQMLLVKDAKMLIILAQPEIVAYDISTPKSPVKKWSFTLSSNTALITARLLDNTFYLVTQTGFDRAQPCPYIPITRGGVSVSVPCGDIWVPARIEPVQHAYTILAINPKTGATAQSLSLAADGGATTVSMFKDNLYLATKSYTTPYDVLIGLTISASSRYLSGSALDKVKRIQGYDISPAGKLSEITQVIEAELAKLPESERLTAQTNLGNELTKQVEAKKRELDRTRVARISLPTLQVAATSEVPGTLLNQFALDEYEGNVRVAVTVNPSFFGWGMGGGETVNDVYVLGLDLKQKGSVLDLGKTERIYSVRFLGDVAYVVTFRQIDPFYVLNLSTPTAPKLVGELKIPGYSAYLEPLGDDLILGVGREGNGVKLSLFDVSNPAKPIEKSKYMLNNEWSEVESNHHAFLKDAAHKVFFLPGGQGGYVLSYDNSELILKATVAGWSVKRAVYLDDYLYIIGDEKITALDETTWKEVKTLTLK